MASFLFIYSSSPFFFIVLIVKVVCAIGFGLNQRIEEILFSLYLTAFPRIQFLVRFFFMFETDFIDMDEKREVVRLPNLSI